MNEFITCPECGGEGITRHRVTVYEHGCGFPHDDTDERPCEECGGSGWVEGDTPMSMEEALEADGEKLRRLTGEDHGPWNIEEVP